MIRPWLCVAVLAGTGAASAHPQHASADSVDSAQMAAVVVDYHRRIAAGDTTAFRHLAPAYVQAQMGGNPDPATWLPSGTTPDEYRRMLREEPVEWMRRERQGEDIYQNEVEILHTRVDGTGGLVATRETGSYLGDGWVARNAWLMVRVDGIWKIGASLHELPGEPAAAGTDTAAVSVER